MRLVPLAGRSEDAIRIALLSHGWGGDLAQSTADGVESLAFHLTQVESGTLEALVLAGGKLGLDIVTGADWALLSGPRARLSSLARPWTSPEPLVELATQLGHALPAESPVVWQTARGPISLERPAIVGIVNLTPDSFSDGGKHNTPDAALRHATALLEAGATLLDAGGESTRPGATPVAEAEELTRVIPVLTALASEFGSAVPLSVDTTKAGVARAALDAGAAIVNDVSAMRLDPAMAPLCAERKAGVVLMHSRGAAGTLASLAHADYPDGLLTAVTAELAAAIAKARAAGIQIGRVVADPGFGFGKTPEQNVELLRGLRALRVLGVPIMVGPSRKRFLGEITGRAIADREVATATACAIAHDGGARLFRVHHPGAARDALTVANAVRPA